jgi:hypothetical protein
VPRTARPRGPATLLFPVPSPVAPVEPTVPLTGRAMIAVGRFLDSFERFAATAPEELMPPSLGRAFREADAEFGRACDAIRTEARR